MSTNDTLKTTGHSSQVNRPLLLAIAAPLVIFALILGSLLLLDWVRGVFSSDLETHSHDISGLHDEQLRAYLLRHPRYTSLSTVFLVALPCLGSTFLAGYAVARKKRWALVSAYGVMFLSAVLAYLFLPSY